MVTIKDFLEYVNQGFHLAFEPSSITSLVDCDLPELQRA
jgi:hypothetical protein